MLPPFAKIILMQSTYKKGLNGRGERVKFLGTFFQKSVLFSYKSVINISPACSII